MQPFLGENLNVDVLKKIGVFFLLFLFCSLVGKSWHYCKDGFSLSRIDFDFSNLRKVHSIEPKQNVAFSQVYSYLGRGRQCYAFVSQDGRYVLKFPRSDCLRIPFWLNSSRFSFLDKRREACLSDKKNRLNFLFNSFSLADSDLKEETALLYLHTSPTDHIGMFVFIRDALGRKYQVDLNKMAFILQEKKTLMVPLLKKCLKQGNKEQAKVMLDAFMEMVALRAKKGIFNKDASFLHNFGFDDGKVVQLDVGSFYRSNQNNPSFASSFQQTTEPIVDWLASVDPDIQNWFKMRASEIVKENS